jgi:chemotaxis protein methyltransferase CheR
MNIAAGTLSEGNLSFLLSFLESSAGIFLQKDQMYLINNRLTPLLKERQLQSLNHLVEALKNGQAGIAKTIVESLTTHETFFFRDQKVFDYFVSTLFPKMRSSAPSGVSVWTAACSSGQEPYSLLMALKETGYNIQNDISLFATDLSGQVLEKAKKGVFSHFEVQRGLPATLLIKYFEKQGGNWKISDDLRSRVTFKEHNLLNSSGAYSRYDCVFCRNVLIYFNAVNVKKVLANLYESLKPNGYLVLGSSELILQDQAWFKLVPEMPGVYQRIK